MTFCLLAKRFRLVFCATLVFSLTIVVYSMLIVPGFSQNGTALQVSGSNTTATCPAKAPGYTISVVETGFEITVVTAALVSYVTWLLVRKATTKVGPLEILRDSDGYGSLTNFQFLVWTAVFLFSIVWVYTVRIQGGVLTPAIGIPSNALALMGVNTASAITSKAITANKENKSKAKAEAKKKPEPSVATEHANNPSPNPNTSGGQDKPSLWTMFNEDDGRPTLARVQMFIWTLVSVAIYIAILVAMLVGPFLNSHAFAATSFCALSIPDVDPTLVTLMGLSHAAFLGRKYYGTTSA